jgi:LysR family hydrogen peroxide-inducible transcriptional activator
MQYVVAVAEELSFRKAAERCGVSQPSLSAQVAEAEKMLDVRLFDRDKRRVIVTPAGDMVVRRAKEILLSTWDLEEMTRREKNPLKGLLRVGVIPTIGPYLLADLDPALRKRFSGLSLQWTEGHTAQLVERVQAGDLDAALVAKEADLHALHFTEVGQDPFVLAVPAGHRLSRGKGRVSTEVLAHEKAFLLSEGNCFRDQALDLCAAAGASEHGFSATSLSTLVQVVASSDGITLLPQMAVEIENRRSSLHLRPFKKPIPSRTIGFVWRRHSALHDALATLASGAREAYGRILKGR